jgi:hypothetical protein
MGTKASGVTDPTMENQHRPFEQFRFGQRFRACQSRASRRKAGRVTLEWRQYLLLSTAGAAAGFIDAIAGGGGLITLPALVWVGLPPQMALGTNKLQSSTLLAVTHFTKAGLVQWRDLRAIIGRDAPRAWSAWPRHPSGVLLAHGGEVSQALRKVFQIPA